MNELCNLNRSPWRHYPCLEANSEGSVGKEKSNGIQEMKGKEFWGQKRDVHFQLCLGVRWLPSEKTDRFLPCWQVLASASPATGLLPPTPPLEHPCFVFLCFSFPFAWELFLFLVLDLDFFLLFSFFFFSVLFQATIPSRLSWPHFWSSRSTSDEPWLSWTSTALWIHLWVYVHVWTKHSKAIQGLPHIQYHVFNQGNLYQSDFRQLYQIICPLIQVGFFFLKISLIYLRNRKREEEEED